MILWLLQQYSTGGQKENTKLVLAVGIGIPLLVVLVAGLAITYHIYLKSFYSRILFWLLYTYHRRKLLNDFQDLGSFKATLSFVDLQCAIYQESNDFFVYWFHRFTRVVGINKEPRKQKVILHRVSGKCVPGQVTAILGPSGSGVRPSR